MRPIWTIDCETDPFRRGRIPKPFLWGVYTGSEFRHFRSTAKMLDWVMQHDVILYAHNGGRFDFHFLLESIPAGERIMVIDGRLVAFRIGRAEFRDSWTLLNVPLAAYKKDDMDYSIMEEGARDVPKNFDRILAYLRDDCIYLHELVTGFVSEFGLALTQASAAMREFSKMRGRGKIPKGNAGVHDAFRPFYYGGRVECLERGVIPVEFQSFDIKSAYPFAMKSEHPWSIEFTRETRLPKNDEEIGPCMVAIEAISGGVFPFRDPSANTLVYPRDTLERRYTVTGWEYLAARETDALDRFRVVEVRRPLEVTNFGDYVGKFYDLRADAKAAGDKARDIFYKIMLNSLYGKFAADPREYSTYLVADPKRLPKGAEIVANLGATVLTRLPAIEESHRFYNIATAASITGYVRAHLWRAIAKSKRPLYCDTDCIAAVDARVEVGSKLGDWEQEGQFDLAALAGRKLYAWRRRGDLKPKQSRWKVASKGVRLTAAEIVKVAKGAPVRTDPEVPTFSILRGVGFTRRTVKRT